MITDSLHRRLRFAAPQPLDNRVVLGERDLLTFECIQRHGPLPTNFLYEFSRHLGRNYAHHQRRLAMLYHGTKEGKPLLLRPPQQFAGFEARYQPVVYDLAPAAKQFLADNGRLHRYSPPRRDHFLHRLATACVSSSFELEAARRRIRYISKEEIFKHHKCPETTRACANPLAIPLVDHSLSSVLVPDDLFGFEYSEGGFRFFAVEIDRNTESIDRRESNQTSFGKKLTSYCEVLRNRLYKAHWGVPNLTVLTVTTNEVHAQNLLRYLSKQSQDGNREKFAFKTEPHFGANWRVPRHLLADLFTPWDRVSKELDISVP